MTPIKIVVHGKKYTITYQLALIMIDGKMSNDLTNTTSKQRGYLCIAISKAFNDIDRMIGNEIQVENLQYGISSLHAWIRLFECCMQNIL